MAVVARPRRASPGALGLYLALSFLYFGARVAAHPGRTYIGTDPDPQIFIWSLAWWPHAVLHGENPIVSHAVWAPTGENLTWVTSVPALAFALAPVTLLFGPVVSWNLASVLFPALAAWTAFLLCRHLTRSFWASLAGGYVFGFSSYMLGHLLGHGHMSSVFLLPVGALLVVRLLEGTLAPRRFAVLLGLVLAAQFALSTEVFFTATLALVVALALARAWRAARPVVAAYAVCAVAVSPLLVYALLGFESESINDPAAFPADLLNFVVPSPLLALGDVHTDSRFAGFLGNLAENGAYLGLPTLAIVAWWAWRRRGGVLLSGFVLVAIASLGTALHVQGDRLAPLPWALVAKLPGFTNVLPVRFALYTSLAAAVIVASWAAARDIPTWVRVVGAAAACIVLVPDVRADAWESHPKRVSFEGCVARGDNVLVLPYPTRNHALLWQAESRFRFRLATAGLNPVPPDGIPYRNAIQTIIDGEVPRGGARTVLAFARAQRVDEIVVPMWQRDPWARVLAPVARPERVGGVLLYRLTPKSRNLKRCERRHLERDGG